MIYFHQFARTLGLSFPNQLRERAISHHFWQPVALNVKFWQLVNLWLNFASLPCIQAGYFEAIMLLFCTPCPNRSQVWRPRRGERWFVIYYSGDHRVLQVITEYYKWSRPWYTVLHCTKAAITLISPPILVIVQDRGIWNKAQVESRMYTSPDPSGCSKWGPQWPLDRQYGDMTQNPYLLLSSSILYFSTQTKSEKIAKFSGNFTFTSFSRWWASAIYHGGQVGWN